MSKVVILGAGASRGTLGEKAPVSAKFGEYLNKKVPCWNKEYPYLAAVVCFLKSRIPDTFEDSWALDKVWGAIDNRVKLRHVLGLSLPGAPFPPPINKKIYKRDIDPWGLAGFELRCAVARIHGDELNCDIQKAADGNGTLKKVIEQLKPGDCVISFNYDLLSEKILKKTNNKRMIIANPYLDAADIKNGILLCKPHGSLNWIQRVPEKGWAVEISEDPIEEDKIDCDQEGVTTQPGIAGPVPFKSEIIFPELQRDVPYFFNLLVAQWRCAIEYLSKADKLIVLGYGFPPEDLHAHYLFAEAAAKRKCNNELQIEVYEKCKQRFKEVENEIKKIFKPKSCKDMGTIKT